jgi:hypothetical protein
MVYASELAVEKRGPAFRELVVAGALASAAILAGGGQFALAGIVAVAGLAATLVQKPEAPEYATEAGGFKKEAGAKKPAPRFTG